MTLINKFLLPLLLGATLSLPTYSVASEIQRATVEHVGKRYLVELEILIDADRDQVYQLLTDFENLAQLNKNILESYKIYSLSDSQHRTFVRTEGCVTFFCQEVTLVEDIEELPGGVIINTAVPEKSTVTFAHTRWKVTAVGKRTRLEYNTDLKPNFWIPPLIGPPLIEKALRNEALTIAANLEKLATASADD